MTQIATTKSTEISVREYFAHAGSPFSKKDAEVIGPVLSRLSEGGEMTANRVVSAAAEENSPLHPYFEWDNVKAGGLFREEQARKILRSIRVRYMDGDKPRDERAFYSVRSYGDLRGDGPAPYKSFSVLREDSAFAAQMMEQALIDLQGWKRKYAPFVGTWDKFSEGFQAALNQVNETIEDCGRVEKPSEEMDAAVAGLVAWRERFAERAALWGKFREYITYMLEAIAALEDALGETGDDTFEAPKAIVKLRACLRCGKQFESEHVGHRMCAPCKVATAGGIDGLPQDAPH